MRAATPRPATPAVAASPVVISLRRERVRGDRSCALHSLTCARWTGAARDHRSHAAPESGKPNHPDVDQQEEHESQGDEEVKRARGLLAAEHIDGRRNRGNKGGRHRQARPDHQREQNEDHEQVGEPLQHVIRPGFASLGRSKRKWLAMTSRTPATKDRPCPGASLSANAHSTS
jgi:hypothetical protein